MINVHVIVWLLTGGVLGSVALLERHFSMVALLVSFVFAIALMRIFGSIRRQPMR
jgi:hypothetical protein